MNRSSSKHPALVAAVVGVAAAIVFVGWHSIGEYRSLAPIYRNTPANSPIHDLSLGRQVFGYAAIAFGLYLGFAVAGAAIAAKTRDRVLWALPGALFVFSTLPGMILFQDRAALRPILDPYAAPGSGTGGWLWLLALADLALVLAPGAVVAWGIARRGETRARSDGAARAAFAVCAVVAFVVYLQHQYVATGSFDVNVGAHAMLLVLFVAGAALGVRRPWFPFVHLLVAVCLSDAVMLLVSIGTPFAVGSTLHMLRSAVSASLPSVAPMAFGASSDLVARYLRRRGSKAQAVPVPA